MADTSTTVQKVAAEALGTFVLVFIGCNAAITTGADVPATGLAFGITVLAGAYAFGRISGAHFNPAVSVGAALGGRMAWRQVPIYVGAQLGGAVVAGLALFVLVHGIDGYSVSDNGLAQNAYGDQSASNFAWWAAFLVEAILTAIFLYVILAVTDGRFEHPGMAPAAIGLTLSMIHFASINLTGTSVNPARSIGVGLFAGGDAIVQLWLFILAPLVGAAIAGVTYPLLFGHGTDPVTGSGWRFARPAPAAVPGYGAPDQFQQEWNQQAVEQAAWEQEPIIQDGWQWDHAAQEWKPLEQWQPAPSPAQTSTPAHAAPPAQADPSPYEPTTQITPAAPEPLADPAPPAEQPPTDPYRPPQ
jgi:aquaporin Z